MSVLTKDRKVTQLNTAYSSLQVKPEAIGASPDQDEITVQYQYQVRVRKQGSYVASHLVWARDALSAINQVELLYGGPVELTDGSIEDKDGTRHHILVANNWHGYTYQAKKV